MLSPALSSVLVKPRLFVGIGILLLTPGRSFLQAQEPRISTVTLQETIADEVLQIKSETDQHRPDEHLGYLWATLAANYRLAGDFAASEKAYFTALSLLDHNPAARKNYGTTLDNLGMLYLSYGRFDEAEKYIKRAVEVRKAVGLPLDLARTQQHLTEVDLAHHKYKDAENGAESALRTMIEQNDTNPFDIVAALNSLTFARCLRGKCEQGAKDAQQSLDTARTAFGDDSTQTACALMAVGFAEWRLGKLEAADRTMQRAIQMMKTHLGSGSRTVALAMTQYRDYLKSVHRDVEAEAVERELIATRNREQVCVGCVNVRSLTNTLK